MTLSIIFRLKPKLVVGDPALKLSKSIPYLLVHKVKFNNHSHTYNYTT